MNPGDFVQYSLHSRGAYTSRGGSVPSRFKPNQGNGNWNYRPVGNHDRTNVDLTPAKNFIQSPHNQLNPSFRGRETHHFKVTKPHHSSPRSPNVTRFKSPELWQSPIPQASLVVAQERWGRTPLHYSPSPSTNSSPSYVRYQQTFSNNSSSMSLSGGYFSTPNNSPSGKRQGRGSHSYRGKSAQGSECNPGGSCDIKDYANLSMLQNPWQELEQLQKSSTDQKLGDTNTS
ncbi:uncharacterized protein LOC143246205 [Tachypleus tridentatus]|uniref:uncharacterized protein LOC143246205 n=1 Tax=Tachypleus tridentatus TaxID=6853 RepID=UPI003FD60FD4